MDGYNFWQVTELMYEEFFSKYVRISSKLRTITCKIMKKFYNVQL